MWVAVSMDYYRNQVSLVSMVIWVAVSIYFQSKRGHAELMAIWVAVSIHFQSKKGQSEWVATWLVNFPKRCRHNLVLSELEAVLAIL